ncbi:RNA-directed DNA polymerase, eukaryota, reverse transcriptase zinc-binding domain protein [Tanacetum coccineum]
MQKRIVRDRAWIMMGDMNVTMVPNEHFTGGSGMTSDMKEFKECINGIEVEDIASSGLFFTWTKNLFKIKVGNYTGVLKKLDRVMGNEGFIDKFSQAHTIFFPYLISDHCPVVTSLPNIIQLRNRAASFSINVNGESFRYFKWGRGLRQGYPMSPYLFTLVIKILTLIVQEKVEKSKEFKYHFGCKKMKLTLVSFADDLLMFCNGDKGSVSVLKEAIEEFGFVADLLPNYNKSTIIFRSMIEEDKKELWNVYFQS